jgi:hypothetical protein
VGYLILWALIMGVCLLINRLLDRPAINPGKTGVIVFLLVMTLDIGVLIYLMAKGPALSQFKMGELFGEAVGQSLIPLILSIIVDGRFRKHQRDTQPSA